MPLSEKQHFRKPVRDISALPFRRHRFGAETSWHRRFGAGRFSAGVRDPSQIDGR